MSNTFSPAYQSDNRTIADRIPSLSKGSKIAVIGAGVFGGWAALHLLRRGYKVTLIDAWGPGNSRASSGGETRLIRCIYGSNALYTRMANRAYTLWQENEELLGKQVLFPTGSLWFADSDSENVIEKALPLLADEGLSYERLTLEETRRRYPLISTEGLSHVIHEKKTGFLLAREACLLVKKLFVKEGGSYLTARANPTFKEDACTSLHLDNGDTLSADQYLFACGPWLKHLFPRILKEKLHVSRQEVYYFGVPALHNRGFAELPTWIDHSPPDHYYGVPSGVGRGFKIAFDRRGDETDPNNQERQPSRIEIDKARAYVGFRFPVLKNAPLLEARVCQYSNTHDANFKFDRHPHYSNLVLLGGGSGHGYKHGPALGELVAGIISGEEEIPADLCLKD